MFGCVVDRKLVGKPPLASSGSIRLLEGGRRVGVEVVHHQRYPFGLGVAFVYQLLYLVRPVRLGAPLAHLYPAPAPKRLAEKEQVLTTPPRS